MPSCIGSLHFPLTTPVELRGGTDAWARPGSPNTLPRLAPWRGHFSVASQRQSQHGKQHGKQEGSDKPDQHTVNPAPGKHINHKKTKPALRVGCWIVRTMIPPPPQRLSANLQEIDNAQKTAVINNELLRLSVDIATLQETRLAEFITLHERDYTIIWRGKAADETRELPAADGHPCDPQPGTSDATWRFQYQSVL